MKIFKKFSKTLTLVLALAMMAAVPAGALAEEMPAPEQAAPAVTAEQDNAVADAGQDESRTVTTLEGAKFVKANGNNYGMGMGTGVIQSAVREGDTIKIYLKKKKILWYTGWITEAYYSSGGTNLVTGGPESGDYYMELDANNITSFAGGRGINLAEIYFDFTPSAPPMMPNPVRNAYFVCDQFNM